LSLAFGMIACSSAPSGTASDGGPDVKPSSDTGAPDSAETSKPPDAGGDARGAICVFGGDGSSFDKGCVFGP
jgi:hypothetical protein